MVDIPITANAGQVADELNRITAAIRTAGGAARDFSSIDLSHNEVGALSNDLQYLVKNFDDLARVSRGPTAASVRSFTGRSMGESVSPERNADQLIDYLNNTGKIFPDAKERQRHVDNVLRYVTTGTSFPQNDESFDDPDTPLAPKQPSGPKDGFFAGHGRKIGTSLISMLGGEGALGGRMGAMMGGLIPELGGPLLALAGIEGASKMVGKAYSGAVSEDKSDDSFLRTLQESTEEFNNLRDATRDASKGLMLTYDQMGDLAKQMAQLGDYDGHTGALDGAKVAVGFGRAIGVDPGAAVGAFGSTAMAGIDPERFAEMIAQAASKGDMLSQSGQVMSALADFATNASRYLVSGSDISGATSNYAKMYAALNGTDQPGLHGANAQAILGQINSSLMGGGGGGTAGQVTVYQAFAKAGIKNPYDVQMALQSGAFTTVPGTGGKDPYQITQSYLASKIKDPTQLAYAMNQLYGVGMPVALSLEKIGPAAFSNATNFMQNAGIEPDQINSAAIPQIVGLLNGTADPATIKKQLLNDSRLSGPDADAIKGASNPKDLMKALVKGLNDTGLSQDDSTKQQQSLIDVQNKLAEVGSALVPLVTKMNQGLSDVLTPLGHISTDLDKWLGNGSGGGGGGGGGATQDRVYVPARSMKGAGGGVSRPLDSDVAAFVSAGATSHGLDPQFMLALATQEGGGKENVSSEGAIGPMQLMPTTASDLRVNPYDWHDNVKGGLTYFSGLLSKYGNNYDMAAGAYNWGPANMDADVAKNGKNWLSHAPQETQNYVHNIDAMAAAFKKAMNNSSVTVTVQHLDRYGRPMPGASVKTTVKPAVPHNPGPRRNMIPNMAPGDDSLT